MKERQYKRSGKTRKEVSENMTLAESLLLVVTGWGISEKTNKLRIAGMRSRSTNNIASDYQIPFLMIFLFALYLVLLYSRFSRKLSSSSPE